MEAMRKGVLKRQDSQSCCLRTLLNGSNLMIPCTMKTQRSKSYLRYPMVSELRGYS